MAAGAGTGAGTMAAGAGTGAGTMAVWAGTRAGNMAAGPGNGAVTMAAGTGTEAGTMAVWAGTGAGNMAAGTGTAGARAGILALRLLEVFWRIRGPLNARRDPEKGSENGDWPSGLCEKTLSHSGNELLNHGMLATSICAFLRAASLSLLAEVLLHSA